MFREKVSGISAKLLPKHNHLMANTPATQHEHKIQDYAAARKVATGTVVFTANDFRKRLMRSISCIVCAVKYDSPQCGQETCGMRSINNSEPATRKLRVTSRK